MTLFTLLFSLATVEAFLPCAAGFLGLHHICVHKGSMENTDLTHMEVLVIKEMSNAAVENLLRYSVSYWLKYSGDQVQLS